MFKFSIPFSKTSNIAGSHGMIKLKELSLFFYKKNLCFQNDVKG